MEDQINFMFVFHVLVLSAVLSHLHYFTLLQTENNIDLIHIPALMWFTHKCFHVLKSTSTLWIRHITMSSPVNSTSHNLCIEIAIWILNFIYLFFCKPMLYKLGLMRRQHCLDEERHAYTCKCKHADGLHMWKD